MTITPVPYYADEHVELYLGDCLDLVDVWAAADVLVTDPPYGVAYRSNHPVTGKTAPIVGDETTALRDAALAAWGSAPALVFGSWKAPRPHGTRHRLIWDKGDVGMGDLAMPWRPGDEEVYVLGHGWKGRRRSNVLRAPNPPGDSRRPDHPTPKPVALMEALIEYAPPGVIADPFAGSGSTLVAARNLGRMSIGVELDERYCEVIASRLAQQAFVFEGLDA